MAGDFAKVEAQYDEQLAKVLPPGALERSWNTSASQLGPFESITSVQTQQAGTNQVAVAACVFKNYSLNLRMVFNDKGLLTGLVTTGVTTRVAWTPPDYANAASFEERAVTIKTGRWGYWRLTLPARNASGRRPRPRIWAKRHGQQQAEPFRTNAAGERGVAVLRYEALAQVRRAVPDDLAR